MIISGVRALVRAKAFSWGSKLCIYQLGGNEVHEASPGESMHDSRPDTVVRSIHLQVGLHEGSN